MADKDAKKEKKKDIEAYSQGKYCPKCGPGVRLAQHADRNSCGKCGYYEKK